MRLIPKGSVLERVKEREPANPGSTVKQPKNGDEGDGHGYVAVCVCVCLSVCACMSLCRFCRVSRSWITVYCLAFTK